MFWFLWVFSSMPASSTGCIRLLSLMWSIAFSSPYSLLGRWLFSRRPSIRKHFWSLELNHTAKTSSHVEWAAAQTCQRRIATAAITLSIAAWSAVVSWGTSFHSATVKSRRAYLPRQLLSYFLCQLSFAAWSFSAQMLLFFLSFFL